jgi:type IV secretory pathway VirB10-like protein
VGYFTLNYSCLMVQPPYYTLLYTLFYTASKAASSYRGAGIVWVEYYRQVSTAHYTYSLTTQSLTRQTTSIPINYATVSSLRVSILNKPDVPLTDLVDHTRCHRKKLPHQSTRLRQLRHPRPSPHHPGQDPPRPSQPSQRRRSHELQFQEQRRQMDLEVEQRRLLVLQSQSRSNLEISFWQDSRGSHHGVSRSFVSR